MLSENESHEGGASQKLKRGVKKFNSLKRRITDLKNSETAKTHKEKMIDSDDTIEIIEDLLLELEESEFGEGSAVVDDIMYYLSQLEENVHELERSQSLAV